MNFILPSFHSLRGRLAFRLASVLELAWWVILGIFLLFLLTDALVFYHYGFGRGVPPAGVPAGEIPRISEATIRAVVLELEREREQFEAAPSVPADLPNPFR